MGGGTVGLLGMCVDWEGREGREGDGWEWIGLDGSTPKSRAMTMTREGQHEKGKGRGRELVIAFPAWNPIGWGIAQKGCKNVVGWIGCIIIIIALCRWAVWSETSKQITQIAASLRPKELTSLSLSLLGERSTLEVG